MELSLLMKNIPYITINKKIKENKTSFVLLDGESYHIDRAIEYLENKSDLEYIYYEVIRLNKVHHSGIINFKKQSDLYKMFDCLYSGELRQLYKNKKTT